MKRLFLFFIVLAFASLACGEPPTPQATQTPYVITATSVATITPIATLTDASLTETLPEGCDSAAAETCFDFNDSSDEGKRPGSPWNDTLISDQAKTIVEQRDHALMLSIQSSPEAVFEGLYLPLKLNEIDSLEGKLKLSENIESANGTVGMGMDFGSGWLHFDVRSHEGGDGATIGCITSDGFGSRAVSVPYDSWRTLRLEIDPDTAAISCFVNNMLVGRYVPSPADLEKFKQTTLYFQLYSWSADGGLVTGYIDDVKIKHR